MVGSVVKARLANASPARDKTKVAIKDIRERGRVRRSPEAKKNSMNPLRINVAGMIHPYFPRARPLGQPKAGAERGCQPSDSRKSNLRNVTVVTPPPNTS